MNELRRSVEEDSPVEITRQLIGIIEHAGEIELDKLEPFGVLLGHGSLEVTRLTCRTVAELAKNEKNRNILTHADVIGELVRHLTSADEELAFQTCRALGNVTFENDAARKIASKVAVENLLALIKRAEDSKRTAVAVGCLMNLLMTDDELQRAALAADAVSTLESVFVRNTADFETNEDCTMHTLQVLSVIVEHMIDEWLPPSLCCTIVDILTVSMNPEISVPCLEILRMQSENDDIKLSLAKKGICELVYTLVEKHGKHVDDEESRSILKMACDLIVLILTGDASMKLLYDGGNGKVYEQMVSWLNSEDVDLLSTGVLAIGNFARSDAHCIEMVENGLAKKLLGILKYYSNDGDTKVQHALLSTLRNLSIPAANKSKLLDENLVETLLSMLNINQSPVEFKLLGTLRMVVDGQEKTAADLISRKDFVEKLVDWCYNSDHLGVRGEAPRLLAWLIKNCRSSDSYNVVLSTPDTIRCLVEMTGSMHAVMQNEALLALNLLAASQLAPLTPLLLSASIGQNFHSVIEKYGEKMERETIENLLTLIERLVTDERMAADFHRETLGNSLMKLNSPSRDRIDALAGKINSA